MNNLIPVFWSGLLPIAILIALAWLYGRSKSYGRKLIEQEKRIRGLEARVEDLLRRKPADEPSSEVVSDPVAPAPASVPIDKTPPTAAPKAAAQSRSEKTRSSAPAKDGFSLDWLQNLNWLVWIGGLALALGGLFVVKYSIENSLLGPWGRIAAGLALGAVMLIVGEWFRRQPEQAGQISSWKYLPLSVSGAGFMTIYGAVYAGFAFYQLYPPVVAIALLALSAAAGLAYALLLGPALAVLALVGAYIVPLLVSTDKASTLLLFIYLFAVLVGSLLVLRYRPWRWIGGANLLASAGWVFLWIAAGLQASADAVVMEIYLAALLSIYIFLFAKPGTENNNGLKGMLNALHQKQLFRSSLFLTYASFLYVFVAAIAISVTQDYAMSAIILAVMISPMAVYAAHRAPEFEAVPILAHLAALVFLTLWPGSLLGLTMDPAYEPVLQDNSEIVRFIAVAMLLAAHFVAFGSWRIARNYEAAIGAGHVVAAPVLVFCIAYWRFNGFGTAPEWAFLALAIAGAFVLAAAGMAKKSKDIGTDYVVAIFAVGATAGLSLAFAAALEKEWLTIAFALPIAATAWIYTKIPVPVFRPLGAILALIVIVRLELDGEVFRFFLAPEATMEWFLYGFGIPIAAFLAALKFFQKQKADYLVMLLESGVILFWTTLLALSIRYLTGIGLILEPTDMGIFVRSHFSFAESAIHGFSLFANAIGIYWLNKRNGSIVRSWSWKILAVLASIALVWGSLLALNPFLFYWGGVGSWYIVDWLFVAYILPACIFAAFRKLAKPEHRFLSSIALAAAGALIFFYVNGEVRHLFVGADIRLGSMSEMEFYTYSVVWLVYASLLLLIGVGFGNVNVRKAGLLLILATVGKVFIFDMAALDGLLRAVSFLGLGACLIGLGFLYQRYGKVWEQAPKADAG